MKGREKVYFLLEKIQDIRQIASSKKSFYLNPIRDLNSEFTEVELKQLLERLETEEKVLKILTNPSIIAGVLSPLTHASGGLSYTIKLLPKFDEYYSNIQSDIEYKEFISRRTANSQLLENKNLKDDNDIVYEIRYSSQTRKILINNFLLSQPDSFGRNDSVFEYLYNNPNQDKSIEDIEKIIKPERVNLNKFVENLGFTADLRKVFFKVTKDTIRFNNPIRKRFLDEIEITHLKINK